jgi:hypothetical protein
MERKSTEDGSAEERTRVWIAQLILTFLFLSIFLTVFLLISSTVRICGDEFWKFNKIPNLLFKKKQSLCRYAIRCSGLGGACRIHYCQAKSQSRKHLFIFVA